MKLFHTHVVCLFLVFSYALGETVEEPDSHKTTKHTTVIPSTSTTTPTPSTSSSTPSPPTTPSTSPVPSTTSASTTPPTPSPTTPPTPPPTSAPTTPTTPSPTPSSSSVPPPSTSPAPSSTTPPPPSYWTVTDPITHNVCIVASMDVTFSLHSENITDDIMIDPAKAHAEGGHCGSNGTSQLLKLVWPLGNSSSSLLITFSEKNKNYFISELDLDLAYNTSDGIKMAKFSDKNLTVYETNVNSSYSCAQDAIPLKENDAHEHVVLKISHLHFEAFKTGNSTSFSSAHYCAGEVPDIVPVVVGICLSGLVLVVVIAYLIGRRKSQASGYLSM